MIGSVNLVYIINTLQVGGAEIGMCRLLNGLDEDKYHITVVVLNGRSTGVEDQIPSSVNIVRLYHSPESSLSIGLKFINIVRNADVIVGSLFHSAIAAKLAGIVNPDATVGTWRHNTLFKNKKRKMVFNLTKSLNDVVLADSEAVAKTLITETSVDRSLVHTVPIAGIDMSRYQPVMHDVTATPIVGTVGRLTKQKNHFTILDVAQRLQDTNIRFKIAGDGELREKLEEETERRSLSNVSFRGFVSDVPEFLSGLDIYFQPSYHEGLCITVLEAMATNLPVIGSDVGGISQNITHGRNGYIHDPQNIEAFAASIQKLSSSADLREEVGREARATVENQYTQSDLVEEMVRAIND